MSVSFVDVASGDVGSAMFFCFVRWRFCCVALRLSRSAAVLVDSQEGCWLYLGGRVCLLIALL